MTDVWPIVQGALGILIGIVLCFAGYALFTALLFMVGFFLGYVVAYDLLLDETGLWILWVVLISIAAGFVAGILTKIFWKAAVFCAGAIGGFLLASMIQSSTSDGLIDPIWALWLFLGGLALICGILAVIFIRPAIICLTAFCGAFGIIAGIDTCLGDHSVFKLDFVALTSKDPHYHLDAKTWVIWVFYSVWLILTFTGIVVQSLGPFGNSDHTEQYSEEKAYLLPKISRKDEETTINH
mmetsp:Transcript_40491/g.56261  ORF Transcript_40491/g.56261 Transcript_40491/m.56261 type:complete len:239 (+) Transcript_40491:142-858(+)|eukprot:CAMPEP_0201504134 /NCGR_PEP_ID=MMETSP0151_2-20130828/85042_1 /ASSEMBLY_ACC=CAM_ASM_000257 /TAXON_ID=200890 /ORGANISM="Paramoeba atlantica, Strain 621/1 / CCAP 1560/9" /LENGTH=238 /DNA_ID=CAMNT_0047897849 /DNA_START=131 /DNA_END=847 /DNA_ORIENTATION=+